MPRLVIPLRCSERSVHRLTALRKSALSRCRQAAYIDRVRIRRRLAVTTKAAALLIAALTTVFVAFAARDVTRIDADRTTLQAEESLLGLNPHQANNAIVVSAVLIFAMSALCLILLIGILRRRQGVRHAAIVVFGLLSFGVLAVTLSGLVADPPSRNAAYGVACGVANAVIAGLLLAPSTADDFSEAEHERNWMRVRGEPLVPQRR